MIGRIEALNFRCLRYVNQPLGPFHVLVGKNASGKSTFLDVLAFLGKLVADGLEAAVNERTQNFYDLMWGRKGTRFELAVEAAIPEEHQTPLESPDYDTIRYEISLGLSQEEQRFAILDEQILLGRSDDLTHEGALGPQARLPATLFERLGDRPWNPLVLRYPPNSCAVSPENPDPATVAQIQDDNYRRMVRPRANHTVLPELDGPEFPATSWLTERLRRGVFHIELQNEKLRQPSPPGKGRFLLPDGSNLPWVVSTLEQEAPQRYADWQAHLRTALPDLQGIRVVERAEDKHRYLMLQYPGDLDVASWMLSDGTLRLLALTIIPYIPDFRPICLIEEPENSMHPLNVETVMQSLQSVYQGQILVATHSPLLLAVVEPKAVLVFSRDDERGTTIVPGDQHPALENWRGEVSLGTLFAGGVLS